MSFLDDTANALALCGEESEQFQETFTDEFIVDDSIINRRLRTVLLLESPHKDEICHKHPLAGKAGKSITRKLLPNQRNNNNVPIGCLLHQGCRCEQANIRDPVISSLGLMNVSRIPLGKNAYPPNIHQQYSELLCYLHAIKGKPFAAFLSNHAPSRVYMAIHMAIHMAIRDDLGRRLRALSSNILVVPCGEVARSFLCRATNMPDYRDGPEIYASNYDVPHPARNMWNRERYQELIESLVNTIRNRANDS